MAVELEGSDLLPVCATSRGDISGRLLKAYSDYLRLPHSLNINKAAAVLMHFRRIKGRPWANYCLFTYGFWLDCQGVTSNDALRAGYYLSQWNLSKNIYRFDEEFLSLLPKLDLNDKPAMSVLKSLPEWCIYVETPNWDLCGLHPAGYFVCLDWHPQDGALIRIGVDFSECLWPCDLAINSKLSFAQIIEEELSHRIEYVAEVSKVTSTVRVKRQALYEEVVRTVMPQIYSICAENSDIVNLTNPSQPLRRCTFGKGKRSSTELLANNLPSVLMVGGNLVKKSKDPVGFKYVDEDGGCKLELDHPGVLSCEELAEKERRETSLVEMIRQTLQSSKSNIEALENTIEELRISNDTLTEEGLTYLEELKGVQERYAQQQNEIIRLTYANYRPDDFSKDKESDVEELIPMDVLGKFIGGNDLKISEALLFVEKVLGSRIRILPDAWASAKEAGSSGQCGRKIITLIYKLATEYLEAYLSKGDSEAKKVFGNVYAARESDSVSNSSELAKQRVFSGMKMTQHLKVNYSVRLYFSVDVQKRKVYIGYCGKHLPIVSR